MAQDHFDKVLEEIALTSTPEVLEKAKARVEEYRKQSLIEFEMRKIAGRLKQETGKTYLECREAVVESENNYELALKILREKTWTDMRDRGYMW